VLSPPDRREPTGPRTRHREQIVSGGAKRVARGAQHERSTDRGGADAVRGPGGGGELRRERADADERESDCGGGESGQPRSARLEPAAHQPERNQHAEQDVREHADDERRHQGRAAAERSRRDEFGATPLLVGAGVPRHEERAHQPSHHGEVAEHLEVDVSAEATAVGQTAQGKQRGRRDCELDDGLAVSIRGVLDLHAGRAREREESGGHDPDRQDDAIPPHPGEHQSQHQRVASAAAASASIWSP
jgi:hypothetical protein